MTASSPALTWTCLFPPDVAYQCAVEAPWMRELLEVHGAGGPTVLVVAGQRASQLPDLRSFQGLVAIDCPGLAEAALRDAGFTHVRRFAVLPSLARPRWFIPLESPVVSAAALCLSAPFKPMARLLHWGVRSAARIGLPVWYRDRICIARRAGSPVESVLQRLFPGRDLRLALSSGSPPPTRNRKVSLAVLDTAGSVLAFVKLPGPTPSARESVEREGEVLATLARAHPRVRAPRLLFTGPLERTFLTIAAPLNGRRTGAEMTEAHRRFLQSMQSSEVKPALKTSFARSLVAGMPQASEYADLTAILRKMMPRLEALTVPSTVVHGDFAPWNLRLEGSTLAAFDWEYAEVDGLPLIDEVHHLLAVGYLLKNWSADEATARLRRHAASRPQGFEPRDALLLQGVYLLHYLVRLLNEGYDERHRRMAWCRQVLVRLAAGTEGGAT